MLGHALQARPAIALWALAVLWINPCGTDCDHMRLDGCAAVRIMNDANGTAVCPAWQLLKAQVAVFERVDERITRRDPAGLIKLWRIDTVQPNCFPDRLKGIPVDDLDGLG